MAPEFDEDNGYDEKVDIFALGNTFSPKLFFWLMIKFY